MNRMFGRLAAAVLLACTAPAFAATWTPLGPEGGPVNAMLLDPNVESWVYALGHSGLFRSEDSGYSWEEAGDGLDSSNLFYAHLLVADRERPGRLYLFETDGRLMRSDDFGKSWKPTGYSTPMPQLPLALVDGAGAGEDLYLTLDQRFVYKSTDGGRSFAPLDNGLPDWRAMASLAQDPLDPLHLIAGGGAIPFPAIDPLPAMYQTRDGGLSWSEAGPAFAFSYTSQVQFFGNGSVAALSSGKLYMSSDSGQNWESRGDTDLQGMVIAVLPTIPQQAMMVDSRRCYRSADYFLTLDDCSNGLGGSAASVIAPRSLAVPVHATHAYRVLLPNNNLGALAWNGDGDSWQRGSVGLRAEWVRGLALSPQDSQQIFAGRVNSVPGRDPLALSVDGGGEWQTVLGDTIKLVRELQIDPTQAATAATTHIYAAGGDNNSFGVNGVIVKSIDGGASWQVLQGGLPAGGIGGITHRLVLDPRSCAVPPASGACQSGPLQTVFALSDAQGSLSHYRVIRSNDAGANWQASSSGLPLPLNEPGSQQVVLPTDLDFDSTDSTLYLATAAYYGSEDGSPLTPTIASGVFRSSDGGASWSQSSTGLPKVDGATDTYQPVRALVTHPRRGGRAWASVVVPGVGSRIYKTTDGGAHWLPSGDELGQCDVRDLRIDPAAPQLIYAAGPALYGKRGCVFLSEDSGETWTALHAGLPAMQVSDLRLDPQDQRTILITTEHGVWLNKVAPDRIFNDNFGVD